MLNAQSCPTLRDPMAEAPLSLGFSKREYWSGLPFPSPGDLPDPEMEPGSLASQVDSLPSEPSEKPLNTYTHTHTHTSPMKAKKHIFPLCSTCKTLIFLNVIPFEYT